jgi:hypothetical protein
MVADQRLSVFGTEVFDMLLFSTVGFRTISERNKLEARGLRKQLPSESIIVVAGASQSRLTQCALPVEPVSIICAFLPPLPCSSTTEVASSPFGAARAQGGLACASGAAPGGDPPPAGLAPVAADAAAAVAAAAVAPAAEGAFAFGASAFDRSPR